MRTFAVLSLCCLWSWPRSALAQAAPDAGVEDSATRIGRLVVEGARREAERQTPYIMEYHSIPYPGGDVPKGTGVCTDLVVRALRNVGIDLQKSVHEDRSAHPEVYPTHIWAYKQPDKNIDHRRCQNLAVWFRRHSQSLTTQTDAAHLRDWSPGDVVFFVRTGDADPWHVAVLSDKKDADGMPMLIDSYPPATSESHRLDAFIPVHSHFRINAKQL